METIIDLIKAVDKIRSLENVNSLVTFIGNLPILESITLSKEDHELTELLEILELSLSSLLLDENGLIIKSCEETLSRVNIKIVKLTNDFNPFTHVLNCGDFNIPFSL